MITRGNTYICSRRRLEVFFFLLFSLPFELCSHTIFSDEGNTSSSNSSENELNNFNSDGEGFCCQPLPLVPPPSPVTPTKNRLNKRVPAIKKKT